MNGSTLESNDQSLVTSAPTAQRRNVGWSLKHPFRATRKWRRALSLIGWLIGSLTCFRGPTLNAAVSQPNVLLIIADDYGVDSSSLYNTNPAASFPPTPNLTALAHNGILFTNAYAHPVCSPTRGGIITGRYAFRTGIDRVVGIDRRLETNENTLPEMLTSSQSGYSLASIGKWHLALGDKSPTVRGGWPYFSGTIGGALPSYTEWTEVINGTSATNTTYATTACVDESIAWINAQGASPWFLWLAFNAPHTPLHKPPNDLHSYDSLSGTEADITANPRPYYEAMVEAMDTEIGRLLTVINLEETLVIFIGDNGSAGTVIQPPYASDRAKDTLYEGGIHIPMIIAGATVVSPDRTSDALVHVTDLYSTILETAGVAPSTAETALPLDSRSLVPILKADTFDPDQDPILIELGETAVKNAKAGRAVLRGDYKLLSLDDGSEEFYHLGTDPTELSNLLLQPLSVEEQTMLDDLRTRLIAWQNEVTIVQPPVLTPGAFSVDVGWFYNQNFSFWRSTDMVDWTEVSNATVQDNGSTVRLTDPAPPTIGNAFYKVKQSE